MNSCSFLSVLTSLFGKGKENYPTHYPKHTVADIAAEVRLTDTDLELNSFKPFGDSCNFQQLFLCVCVCVTRIVAT